MNCYLNYNGIQVPFTNLDKGILDRCIQNNLAVGTDQEVANHFIRPGDIVYDIGAYIGTHSIRYALNGGIVYAFEPSPNNFSRCQRHCSPFKQIKVFNVALHDQEYQCETRFKDCNASEATLSEADPIQKINYVILPKFVKENNLPYPKFIKMDIEGMETIVLKTIEEWLINVRPILLVECHVRPRDCFYQVYKDNPHWLYPDEGGFDFNLFHKHAYFVIEERHGKLYPLKGDFNKNMTGGALLCIPIEKWIQNPLEQTQ